MWRKNFSTKNETWDNKIFNNMRLGATKLANIFNIRVMQSIINNNCFYIATLRPPPPKGVRLLLCIRRVRLKKDEGVDF